MLATDIVALLPTIDVWLIQLEQVFIALKLNFNRFRVSPSLPFSGQSTGSWIA